LASEEIEASKEGIAYVRDLLIKSSIRMMLRAAEALFAPRRRPDQSIRNAGGPAGELVRKQRVLSVSTPPGPREPAAHKIPKSLFARIRTRRRYGMTPQQVAEVYGRFGRRDRAHSSGGLTPAQPFGLAPGAVLFVGFST